MFAALPDQGALGDMVSLPAVRSRHSLSFSGKAAAGAEATTSSNATEYRKISFEVPLSISRRFRDVQFKTLVGVSPLVPCALYSVDDTVILWRFRDGKESTLQCDGVVTALCLGVPSPFVFSTAAKFILVVATENSVAIYPLDSELKQIKSSSTSSPNFADTGAYFLPIPKKTFFSQVAVTVTGRILLWTPQDPSTVHELRYKSTASWFKSRVFFQYHSLLFAGPSSSNMNGNGLVAEAISKLMRTFSIAPKLEADQCGLKLYIQPESTFRFFVTVDSNAVSLYQLSEAAPTPCEAATASWRHREGSDLMLTCIGRMQLADLAVGTTSPRVLFASVAVAVDSSEPFVELVTDHAELVTLRCISGQLVVFKSRSHHSVQDLVHLGSFKRQRTFSPEEKPTSVYSFTSAGTAVGEQLFVTASGTQVTVTTNFGEEGGSSSSLFDLNASVLAVASEKRVEQDSLGSFVLPVLLSSESSGLIPPFNAWGSAPLIVLTGKGVTVLDPVEATAAPPAAVPRSVSEIVGILSASSPAVSLAYKPMFLRAISDDVKVSSLLAEQDFCSREKRVKPVSGSLWIAGVQRLADSLLFVLRNEPVFVKSQIREGIRVGISESVLETLGSRIRNLVKFVKLVLASSPSLPADASSSSSFKRREFMHSGHQTREQVLKMHATNTLNRIVESLSFIGEVVGFFSVLASFRPLSSESISEAFVSEKWTVSDFQLPILSKICENLIKLNSSKMTDIVDKLKLVAPSILCTVSPAVVPFSPEGVAAMLQCALAQDSPVFVLLESVKTLARTTPLISQTLSEVTKIIRSLENKKEVVLEAALDGLQERLIDASVVQEVLTWTGSTLSSELNEFVLSYLFSRGNWQNIDSAAAANPWIEKFLVSRLHINRTFSEVYAKVQMRAGKASVAGEVLEKAAFNAQIDLPLSERISLLEQANEIYPVHRRLELTAIAKYIQLPLSQRLEGLEDTLLSVSDLHLLVAEQGFFDLVLTCYLFVPMKESEVIKAWTKCILSDVGFFSTVSGEAGTAGIVNGAAKFLRKLHAVSKSIESFSIWRKPELIAALLEYLSCLTQVQARSGWVANEFLMGTLKLTPQQSVEVYSRMIRELNVWLMKIPKVQGNFAAPSLETVKTRLIDQVVALAQSEMNSMHLGQLQSVLILIKNYVKDEHPALVHLIEKLSCCSQSDHSRPSQALPAM